MSSVLAKNMKCNNEYDTLQQVILCEPQYMSIQKTINETQKYYADNGIDTELAMEQHQNFVKALNNHNVSTVMLPSLEEFNEQVFTRDIGFVIGEALFTGSMASTLRKDEVNVLKEWLQKNGVSYYDFKFGIIEGGDVIVDHKTVYVGVSNRTNEQAITTLQDYLPGYEVIPIPIGDKYLHLDCVFNIISSNVALIYRNALPESRQRLLESKFNLIEITEEEQFTLGTNVLPIGNNKVISLPINKRVNRKMREYGFTVIEVDISEIIKSGGAFRCCTLPIVRGLS